MGTFGYRLNGVAAHLDTGIAYSQGSRYVASGTFDFKPTDRLTITADIEYFEKSIVEPALFLLTIPSGSTRSEEHTSELQSLMRIAYAVFCLKKKKIKKEMHVKPNY